MSALSDLAASMAVGTFASLSSIGMDAVFHGSGGFSGTINPYAMRAVYDSVLKRIHFLGSDHGGGDWRHCVYDLASNTHSVLPDPPWLIYPTDYNDAHGYCLTALSVSNRRLYRMPYGTADVYYFNLDSGVWTGPFSDTLDPNGQVINSIAFFDDINSLALLSSRGRQDKYSESTGLWTNFGLTSTMNSTWNWVTNDPVNHLVIMGSSTNALWKYTAAGVFSRQADLAASLIYPSDGNGQKIGCWDVDPVTGTHIILTSSDYSRVLKNYNPLTDTWSANSAVVPSFPALTSIVSTPVPEYGVICYEWSAGGGGTLGGQINGMFLYKHAASTPPDPPPPDNTLKLALLRL
jgi:hypothetical protein